LNKPRRRVSDLALSTRQNQNQSQNAPPIMRIVADFFLEKYRVRIRVIRGVLVFG